MLILHFQSILSTLSECDARLVSIKSQCRQIAVESWSSKPLDLLQDVVALQSSSSHLRRDVKTAALEQQRIVEQHSAVAQEVALTCTWLKNKMAAMQFNPTLPLSGLTLRRREEEVNLIRHDVCAKVYL